MSDIDVKFMKGNRQTAKAIGLKIKPQKKKKTTSSKKGKK